MNQNLNDLDITTNLGWMLYRLDLLNDEPYKWNLLGAERDNLMYRHQKDLDNHNGGKDAD